MPSSFVIRRSSLWSEVVPGRLLSEDVARQLAEQPGSYLDLSDYDAYYHTKNRKGTAPSETHAGQR